MRIITTPLAWPQGRGTISSGARNTTKLAVSLSDNEVFSRPEFGNAALRRVHGFGRDGQNGNAWRTTNFVFRTSRPIPARRNAVIGLQSQLGAETMTKVIHLAHARAITSTTPNTGTDAAIARHFAIVNALRAALVTVGKPDATPHDLRTATARANRALTLLKHACAELTSATPTTSGRA
jgi:hypothetical protein